MRLYYTGTNGLGGENRKDLTKKEDTSDIKSEQKIQKMQKTKKENKRKLILIYIF